MKINLKKIYKHIVYKNISNKNYENNEKLKSCLFFKEIKKIEIHQKYNRY